MDEEIIEAQKENEKELKNDLDLANGRNNDFMRQIRSYAQQVEDYEKTIMKFRQRVADLNAEIQEQQDQVSFRIFKCLFCYFDQ
ncbi:unnamed protein product [Gongylonema pulchrum]|uniref:TACC_C domain-containing protein n=1 Tax=Gongylonema pulchrum TaxID=637853 RepID=A0A183DIC0_9BILA|nr:unnamed protein product [Gongylonema pulchrum]